MDPENPSVITRKSSEQVMHQMRLIALDDRSRSIDESPDLGDKYSEYLKILRGLRRSQREEIGSQIENRLDRSPKEVLLEAARYSERSGQSLLFNLCFNPGNKGYDVFDYAECVNEARTEHSFFAALEKILATNPTAVYRSLSKLMLVLPTERILKAIVEAGPHPGFMENFNLIKSHFTPEDQIKFIGSYMYNPEYGHIILTFFQNPDACSLYSDEEVRNAILIELQGNIYGIDPIAMINQYVSEREIITPDDLYEVATRRIETFMPINFIPHVGEQLPDGESVRKLLETVNQTYQSRACVNQLWVLLGVNHLLTHDQIFTIVQNTLVRDPFKSGFDIVTCEKLLDSSDVRPLLQEALVSPDLPITREGISAIMNSRSLTDDDKEKFIQRVIDEGKAELALYEIRSISLAFFRSERLDRIAHQILFHCNQTFVAERYRHHDGWGSDSISETVLRDVINRCTDFSAVKVWTERPEWCMRFSKDRFPDTVPNFIEKHVDTHGELFLPQLHKFLWYVTDDRRFDFERRIVKCNPVLAMALIDYSSSDFTISMHDVVDIAQSDKERASLSPQNIEAFWRRLRLHVPFEQQTSLIMEGHHLYQAINQIKRMGMESELQDLLSSSQHSIKEEREAVGLYQCFATMKERHPEKFEHLVYYGKTIDEARKILMNELSRLLSEGVVDAEGKSSNEFFHSLETPGPFMLYVLQYIDSPEHKALLIQIFTALSTGSFDKWKFGPSDPESFADLKHKGLIPAKMEARQYDSWRSDDTTTLYESLTADTSIIAQAVRKYIEDNLMHFEVSETFQYITNKYPNMDMVSALKEETAIIGARLAQIGKTLAQLKRENSSSAEEHMRQLLIEKDQLDISRRKMIRLRYVGRLTDLKPNEIASGYISKGDEGKRNGEKIVTIINSLRGSADIGNYFVYDELLRMVQSQGEVEVVKQNLTVTDSSDPKVWMEIGENPVSSCQSYNGGVMNECLLGYTDPNTKFLIVKNERGNIIARSVFRILSREDGSPALHIERVYSSSMSPSVLKCIFSLAYKKAFEMGVPLFISRQSQAEDGIEQDAQQAEGFNLSDVNFSLYSHASRAPSVYVDSAGGKSENGVYEMRDLAEIHLIRATPINI